VLASAKALALIGEASEKRMRQLSARTCG